MSNTALSRSVQVILQTDPTQTQRLQALQEEFAQACNALAPLVQSSACWNRVALHHMAYRLLRQQFPGLGSQMACNAIYSVSRTCRLVYQHKASPFNLQRLAGRPLPLLRFSPTSPVFFDRHTLSVKDGKASMYTLDGRMRFQLLLGPDDEERFRSERLGEIVLHRIEDRFALTFTFGPAPDGAEPADSPVVNGIAAIDARSTSAPIGTPLALDAQGRLPRHVAVVGLHEGALGGAPAEDEAAPAPAHLQVPYPAPLDPGTPTHSTLQHRS